MTPEQFKDIRMFLGFTQRQLSETWGMGKNGDRTIRRWESGDVPVNPVAAYCIKQMAMTSGFTILGY